MNKMGFLAALLAALFAAPALAKLPPPSDEAKAKAAEAAAKTVWSGKVDSYKLCKSMDQVAATYHAQAKTAGKDAKPAVATPPCVDPGSFAYVPASAASAAAVAPPLEAAGAHSPAKTAAAPPSTKTPQAATPAKK